MHTVMLYLTGKTVQWSIHLFRPLRSLIIRKDVNGSNIGLTEKTAMELPDEKMHSYREGSIYAFVAWISYICMVWSFKGVLMFLYNRITLVTPVWKRVAIHDCWWYNRTGLWQHRLTLIMGAFCVCTFLSAIIFDLAICHPIEKNWQVKPYAGGN